MKTPIKGSSLLIVNNDLFIIPMGDKRRAKEGSPYQNQVALL